MTTSVCVHCKRKPKSGKLRARGLCGSCYVTLNKTQNHLNYPATLERLIEVFVEELEFLEMDWDQVEATFKRGRNRVKDTLKYYGREDLVIKVNRVHVARHGNKPRGPQLKV